MDGRVELLQHRREEHRAIAEQHRQLLSTLRMNPDPKNAGGEIQQPGGDGSRLRDQGPADLGRPVFAEIDLTVRPMLEI